MPKTTQSISINSRAGMRSQLRSREVSERKQVGDAEALVNEEGESWDEESEL